MRITFVLITSESGRWYVDNYEILFCLKLTIKKKLTQKKCYRYNIHNYTYTPVLTLIIMVNSRSKKLYQQKYSLNVNVECDE